MRREGWGGFCLLGLFLGLCGHVPRALGQLSTDDHLAEPGFWATKDQDSREAFVGPEACARCHGGKVSSQKETPMARNLMPAATADVLHSHPAMSFTAGNVQYHVDKTANQSLYSVTDGKQKLSYPLTWAFGTGRVAQSYLFKKEDDSYYEARVTYFVSLGTIDFTPFRTLLHPSSIEEAMYRPVGQTEVQRLLRLPRNCGQYRRTLRREAFDSRSNLRSLPRPGRKPCESDGRSHRRQA